jgi:hypothetical protein
MWDDIVIGKCETSGSATTIPSQCSGFHAPPKGTKTCKSHISENKRSYWITTDFLDMGMKIAKDTDEGEALTCLLNAENWDGIDMFLSAIVIRHVTPDLIVKKIADAESEAYKNGQDDARFEMRKALGIDRRW